MEASHPQRVTEEHVLAHLAGMPLQRAAAHIPLEPADLADAVEIYRAAGRAALAAQPRTANWHQVRLRWPDWHTAEQQAAAHLAPHLDRLQQAGTLTGWWFLRKHPYWRLRCRPGPHIAPGAAAKALGAVLDTLTAQGAFQQWRETIYEPETLTFGGGTGMDISHQLFHDDSRNILLSLPEHTTGRVRRRELSVLLCTALFRGARQDDHEQADIWHRIAEERPLETEPPRAKLHAMGTKLNRLIRLDTAPISPLVTDGVLGFATDWLTAFTTAGRHLADAARDGTLERGLRGVLASHVIFHWNRLGLPAATQAVLARAARHTLLDPAPDDQEA